jgi:hypothetical protein
LTNGADYVIIYTERERNEVNKMINIRSILKLKNNDGLTLKKGKKVKYKTGWQVATEGKETTNPREAMNLVKEYKGDCGIWFADGIYYIDKSHRVNTKKEALRIGRECNQISVLNWRTMGLAYC